METHGTNTSQARIFLGYDVNTGFTLEVRLGIMSTAESGLLHDRLSKNPPRPVGLLVLDRNFGYFYNVHLMICEEKALVYPDVYRDD